MPSIQPLPEFNPANDPNLRTEQQSALSRPAALYPAALQEEIDCFFARRFLGEAPNLLFTAAHLLSQPVMHEGINAAQRELQTEYLPFRDELRLLAGRWDVILDSLRDLASAGLPSWQRAYNDLIKPALFELEDFLNRYRPVHNTLIERWRNAIPPEERPYSNVSFEMSEQEEDDSGELTPSGLTLTPAEPFDITSFMEDQNRQALEFLLEAVNSHIYQQEYGETAVGASVMLNSINSLCPLAIDETVRPICPLLPGGSFGFVALRTAATMAEIKSNLEKEHIRSAVEGEPLAIDFASSAHARHEARVRFGFFFPVLDGSVKYDEATERLHLDIKLSGSGLSPWENVLPVLSSAVSGAAEVCRLHGGNLETSIDREAHTLKASITLPARRGDAGFTGVFPPHESSLMPLPDSDADIIKCIDMCTGEQTVSRASYNFTFPKAAVLSLPALAGVQRAIRTADDICSRVPALRSVSLHGSGFVSGILKTITDGKGQISMDGEGQGPAESDAAPFRRHGFIDDPLEWEDGYEEAFRRRYDPQSGARSVSRIRASLLLLENAEIRELISQLASKSSAIILDLSRSSDETIMRPREYTETTRNILKQSVGMADRIAALHTSTEIKCCISGTKSLMVSDVGLEAHSAEIEILDEQDNLLAIGWFERESRQLQFREHDAQLAAEFTERCGKALGEDRYSKAEDVKSTLAASGIIIPDRLASSFTAVDPAEMPEDTFIMDFEHRETAEQLAKNPYIFLRRNGSEITAEAAEEPAVKADTVYGYMRGLDGSPSTAIRSYGYARTMHEEGDSWFVPTDAFLEAYSAENDEE